MVRILKWWFFIQKICIECRTHSIIEYTDKIIVNEYCNGNANRTVNEYHGRFPNRPISSKKVFQMFKNFFVRYFITFTNSIYQLNSISFKFVGFIEDYRYFVEKNSFLTLVQRRLSVSRDVPLTPRIPQSIYPTSLI